MSKNLQIVLGSIFFSLVFLFIFYSPIFVNPDQHLFADGGDGIKNYYTYAYHIQYDSSNVHFEGMNYPYGDLLQFSDGQPLVSNTLKFLANKVDSIKEHPVGWLNILLLLSFSIAVIFVALILKKFKVPVWLSILAAIGIVGLSPQIFRMSGHLSLAYFFSFPLFWWLVLQDDHLNKWYVCVITGLVNLGILFIHPYLALINASYVLVYLVFRHYKQFRSKWLPILIRWFIIVISPIVIWKLYLHFNDHHIQRAEDVFYLTGNTATLASIITPPFGYLNTLLNQVTRVDIAWEGWAYIGMVSLFFIILFPLIQVIKKIRSEKLIQKPSAALLPLRISLYASLPILLFSFGYPYRFGMEFLLDWLPPLKQIRALGRFAWVFYYIVNVFTVAYLWNIISTRFTQNRFLPKVLMGAIISVLLMEAVFYHKENGELITKAPNVFSIENYSGLIADILANKDKLDVVQAIIPFPYFHIGGAENSYEPGGASIMKEAMTLSYHTGIPLMASAMSRTSEIEARENIQFLTYPWIKKVQNKGRLTNHNDYIILTKPNTPISASEQYWVDRAELIYSSENITLSRIDPVSFTNFDPFEFIQTNHIDTSLSVEEFYKSSGKYLLVTKEKVEGSLDLKGAKTGKMNDFNTLYDGYEYWFNADDILQISFWYDNSPRMAHSNTFVLAEIDEEGNEQWTQVSNMRNTKHFKGNWSLMNYEFKLRPNTRRVKIFMKSWSRNNETINWRDVLIREKLTNVSFMMNDTLFYNNFRIPLP